MKYDKKMAVLAIVVATLLGLFVYLVATVEDLNRVYVFETLYEEDGYTGFTKVEADDYTMFVIHGKNNEVIGTSYQLTSEVINTKSAVTDYGINTGDAFGEITVLVSFDSESNILEVSLLYTSGKYLLLEGNIASDYTGESASDLTDIDTTGGITCTNDTIKALVEKAVSIEEGSN